MVSSHSRVIVQVVVIVKQIKQKHTHTHTHIYTFTHFNASNPAKSREKVLETKLFKNFQNFKKPCAIHQLNLQFYFFPKFKSALYAGLQRMFR